MEIKEADHAFLSNCRTSALEANGEIDWFPASRFDSRSVFAKILDRKAGSFSISPSGGYASRSSYIGNSLALKTIFRTKNGELKIIDFLPLNKNAIVRIYESDIGFYSTITPMFDYGRFGSTAEVNGDWVTFRSKNSKEALEVLVKGKFRFIGGKLHFGAGKGYLIAYYSENILKNSEKNSKTSLDPYKSLDISREYWESAVKQAKKVSNFKEAYLRSIAVSVGCMYMPTGAVVAAPTTSIPEIIGDQRNWDYRYSWIRDSSYAAESLSKAGLCHMSRKILSFLFGLVDKSAGSFLHPLFAVDGGSPEKERILDWLEGYRNSRPVRVGNAAFMQLQMDSEGNFLDALYTYFRQSNDIAFIRDNWRAISGMAARTERSWRDKSTSLWEEREELRHFVHTKVMEWVALDRASRLADAIGKKEEGRRLNEAGAKVKEDVLKNGFSKKDNTFVKYYGSSEVDAALLTLPLCGFIDANDKRFSSTFERIISDLQVRPGLLIRYKSDAMGKVAHPFTLLSFWLARVYLRRGEKKKAMATVKNILSYSTDLGLIAEHIDYQKHEQRGNFPQLFPHSGLIETLVESEYRDLMKL